MSTTSPDETTILPPTPIKKPPLGLVPKKIRQEQRLREIAGAIQRYIEDGETTIPPEWIAEYNLLIVSMRRP